MKRIAEMILGILGSVFAFGSAYFALFIGQIDKSINHSDQIFNMGSAAFIFAIIGLIFSILVNWKPKFSGIVMVISAIIILISTGLFGVLPAILIFIGGLMGILRKIK